MATVEPEEVEGHLASQKRKERSEVNESEHGRALSNQFVVKFSVGYNGYISSHKCIL